MAQVTTSVNLSPGITTYAGVTSIRREDSAIPVGELLFTKTNQAIAAVGAGDNQAFIITMTLPRNFAYVLCDLAVDVNTSAAGTNNWGNQLRAYAVNDASASQYRLPIPMTTPGAYLTSAALEGRIWTPGHVPGMTIIPATGSSTPQIVIAGYNATANDNGYSLSCYARAFSYTLDQVRNYQVNAPMPVRMC